MQYPTRPTARKSLGQHFLRDEGVLAAMADALAPPPGARVLEIGPGDGALTRRLLERGAQVTALEIDENLRPHLQPLEAEGRLRVRFEDALQARWPQVCEETDPPAAYLAANLPYYITTPLLEKVLDARLPVVRAVVLMQSEAADRLTARPGTRAFGPLALALASRAEASLICEVPPGAFEPPPHVTSRALLLSMRPCDPAAQARLMRLARAAFAHRRKTLRNALAGAFPAQRLQDALAACGLSLTARPEELPRDVFQRLADALYFADRE